MIQLKQLLLSTPVKDTDGQVYDTACIGIYEVFVTGRQSYLDVGFEMYKNQDDCNNQVNPIKVEELTNNKRFDLTQEEFIAGADWEDIAADKMIDYLTELFPAE